MIKHYFADVGKLLLCCETICYSYRRTIIEVFILQEACSGSSHAALRSQRLRAVLQVALEPLPGLIHSVWQVHKGDQGTRHILDEKSEHAVCGTSLIGVDTL